MPTVIPVKFRYAARDLWFDPGTSGAIEADHVICATERGMEIGLATGDPREIGQDELDKAIGHSKLKTVDRVATEGDLRHAEKLAKRGEDALPVFRRLVDESGLDMKPVGVEYLFGGEKVVCYFAAEERVDFRQLVRDLSHNLHERIDMRQIGVREEAAIKGGFGHCGQELCCSRFGLQFEPVSIRMAKEQDLPLNSSKISGACGRLMCCLRYEFEAYRDFKSRAPKRNAVIDTPLGKAKIVEYDTPKEELCLRVENGKQIRVPLSEMVASDAAKRKSQELNCPCRPDTVLRSTLDKLNSPEVQMALAELDRKMGVKPAEPDFDESDIFVEARPRRRKGHGGEAEGSSGGEQRQQGQGRANAKQGQQQRRRRNGSGGTARTGGQQERPSQQAGEGRARRRHRRASEGQAQAQQAQASRQAQPQPRREEGKAQASGASQAQPKNTRRRRHHSADGGQGAPEQKKSARPSGGQRSSSAQEQPKHLRHPGDHGGQQSRQRPEGEAGTSRRRHHRS